MPSSPNQSAGRGMLAALALVTLAACSRGTDTGTERFAAGEEERNEAAYVGSEVCAQCHAEQAGSWAGSHHDLAMQPAAPDTVLGRFEDTPFVYDGITSVFSRRGDEFWVRTDGPSGELADFKVTHAFGVSPLQQYLIELPGGGLHALGIAWDTRPAVDGGQRWFHLYAGEQVHASDPLHWTRTAQSWNTSCAACHSTGLVKDYRVVEDTFATRWADIDVGCEACHGPGSAHAAAPSEAQLVLAAAARSWVFAADTGIAQRVPAAGSGVQDGAEIDVCAQCHSRRAQIHDEFAADEPLLDNFVPALLDEELYHADGQIEGEVFEYGSFVQSAMHAAGVTCSDCHDPHSAALKAEGNALCGGCHVPSVFDTPQHHRHEITEGGGACVDCHMRPETYMVVDDRRDHSFRVPRPDLSVTLGTPNACNDCHRDESAEWSAARIEEWFPGGRHTESHFGEALFAGRNWGAGRSALLSALIENETAPAIARATAVRLLAAQSDGAALEGLEHALADDDERVQLAALESLEAVPVDLRPRLAQRFLGSERRALRVSAARALAAARPLLSERRRADLDAGLEEYIAVQAFNSDRVEGLFNRANLFAESGQWEPAEAGYRAAIELEPSFAPAYVNLADMTRRQGREADAEAQLREGLSRNPDDSGLHHALGLSLVRSGRLDDALVSLQRAAQLSPEQPQYRYALGIALSSAGETERALESLHLAHEQFPGHAPTLFALATLHRDGGDIERALDYTRRLLAIAPGDANARALQTELRTAAAE